MARYPLNLPEQLKREAEQWAAKQGVSLNQFVMWAVAEKVGALGARLDDSDHPHVTYRRGASGVPTPLCVEQAFVYRHWWLLVSNGNGHPIKSLQSMVCRHPRSVMLWHSMMRIALK